MEKYTYGCDGGSLLIGNPDFACCFLNNIGDGDYTVIVCDRSEKDCIEGEYSFLGTVEGKAYLYDYDGYGEYSRGNPDCILCELNGLYYVYAKRGDSGDMLIVRNGSQRP